MTRKKTENWIIIYGTPTDGLGFVGPFHTFEEAQDAAENNEFIGDREWWVTELQSLESLK